jgi:hypothetical protein
MRQIECLEFPYFCNDTNLCFGNLHHINSIIQAVADACPWALHSYTTGDCAIPSVCHGRCYGTSSPVSPHTAPCSSRRESRNLAVIMCVFYVAPPTTICNKSNKRKYCNCTWYVCPMRNLNLGDGILSMLLQGYRRQAAHILNNRNL